MITFTDYPDHEAWLAGRRNSLGASEVASVIGCGFCNEQELWAQKVGESKPKDLSQNARVKYGTEAEQYLRGLFAVQFADTYEVEYHPYRVYSNDESPFMTATLDGELKRKSDGEQGVWECKTAWVLRKEDLNEWFQQIPQKYFCQVTQQLYVTNRKFAVLTAQLIFNDGTSEIRHYDISRNEENIAYIVSEAKRFWKHVTERTKPALGLTL